MDVILVLSVICIILYGIIKLLTKDAVEQSEKADNNLNTIEQKLDNWVRDNNVKVTKKIPFRHNWSDGVTSINLAKDVIIDEVAENIYIFNHLLFNDNLVDPVVIQFKDVIGMEIQEDGHQTDAIGRAVIGGAMFGTAGAIVGAQTANESIKLITLKIYLNNISTPTYSLTCGIGGKPMQKKSYDYIVVNSFIKAVYDVCKVIVHKNENI